MENFPKILIYGYGNPGRQDDALGILASDIIECWANNNDFKNISVMQNFQLNIEDALTISQYDIVIFIDAALNLACSYEYLALKESLQVEFSMHSVSPGFVLSICSQMFDKVPHAYILKIGGEVFNFNEELSKKAFENLQEAVKFLKNKLRNYLQAFVYHQN